jgi:hypothetical protein
MCGNGQGARIHAMPPASTGATDVIILVEPDAGTDARLLDARDLSNGVTPWLIDPKSVSIESFHAS